MRRLALILVVVLALAACGGSGTKSTTTAETGPSPAATKQQIKTAYVNFFSSKTNVAGKVALLQNGAQFKSLIESFVKNPLAKNVSATVSSVTLQGANNAKVVYIVKVGGAALGKQTGTAVRESGQWKVGYGSLCKLIALGGTTPSVCKS